MQNNRKEYPIAYKLQAISSLSWNSISIWYAEHSDEGELKVIFGHIADWFQPAHSHTRANP